jgi:hypothetical protein
MGVKLSKIEVRTSIVTGIYRLPEVLLEVVSIKDY